jgi:hypothetical protein
MGQSHIPVVITLNFSRLIRIQRASVCVNALAPYVGHIRVKCSDICGRIKTFLALSRNLYLKKKVKVKWSRYRPAVAQRVGRGLALLFHDRGTRRWWVVSRTPRQHFTPGKDSVPNLEEAGWAPGPVWSGGKSRPYRDSIPDRPACSQSLYRLRYPAH